MSSVRGRVLATVAVASFVALASATPAEARRGYYRGGGGCCSSAEWAAIGLGAAALGGFAYLAATRSSAPAATYYAPAPAYYPAYPAYYAPAPAYYYAPAYYPAYYAPAYYYAPPAPPPVPVAAPAYPPQPAFTTVNYYYEPGPQAAPVQAVAPSPYGSAPYSRTTNGTVVNPPSPYPNGSQYQTVGAPRPAPTVPVSRATLATVP